MRLWRNRFRPAMCRPSVGTTSRGFRRAAQILRMLATWKNHSLAALIGVSLFTPSARAEDPCGAFTWDLSLERALFGEAPIAQPAGRDAGSAPTLNIGALYALQLRPEHDVGFVLKPGSTRHSEGTYGGLAHFSVSPPGTYRVSADQPVWIDIVLNGQAIASKDFQGHAGCIAPHKVVEFDLPATEPLTLQISGGAKPVVRLTVTPAPAPVSAPPTRP